MLWISLKDADNEEITSSWHIGDKLPELEFNNNKEIEEYWLRGDKRFPAPQPYYYKREIISIQADGDELNFIYLLVSGIPVPKIPLRVVTWHQPWAQFIYDCMVGVEVTGQIYDKRIHKIVKKGS